MRTALSICSLLVFALCLAVLYDHGPPGADRDHPLLATPNLSKSLGPTVEVRSTSNGGVGASTKSAVADHTFRI